VNRAIILKFIDFINVEYFVKKSMIIFTVRTHGPCEVTKCY